MENASKALIIAGGVLIAIIIIGFLVLATGNIQTIVSTEETNKEVEQLKQFNMQYESYKRMSMRGSDVASVINKIRSNNVQYKDEPEYRIEWKMIIVQGVTSGTNQLRPGTYKDDANNSCTAYDKILIYKLIKLMELKLD